ncbi:MAC/Perforin domain [Carpediemonas membranifera]|uniref:MAC/Perforin domain n=1 Tax=Carpediemonas membranifera TaxID=201153 RepID=A0A8J6AUQ7_9EUKA|nr:MAC/Perforin domain [Carpediemonas membranifera]|eukprot:KAG9395236.1 MAC/Perforin domain [Carpediemonas membranifera]
MRVILLFSLIIAVLTTFPGSVLGGGLQGYANQLRSDACAKTGGRYNSFTSFKCGNGFELPNDATNAIPSPAVAGVGWDIVTGSSTMPLFSITYDSGHVVNGWMFPDNQAVSFLGNRVVPESNSFDSLGPFLRSLSFPANSNSPALGGVRGGLYATRPNMLNFYASTFKDLTKFSHSRVAVQSFQVSLPNDAPLSPYLSAAFDYLATAPTRANFDAFISYFGTHAVISAIYGGIAEQDAIVQNIAFCAGFTDYDMTQNSEAELLNTLVPGSRGNPPTHTEYIEHRSLGVVDLKGGNPEFPDWPRRSASFESDPVVTDATVIPIWTQVGNPTVRAGLKAAIDDYMGRNYAALQREAANLHMRTLSPVYRYAHTRGYLDHMVLFSTSELGCTHNKPDYTLEGVLGYSPQTNVLGTVPLYRAFRPHNGDHFFTTSYPELQLACRNGYEQEGGPGGVGWVWPSQQAGSMIPIRRCYNGNDHLYTAGSCPAQAGFREEGISFWLNSHSYLD